MRKQGPHNLLVYSESRGAMRNEGGASVAGSIKREKVGEVRAE
jgi:hypothetical protein